MSDRRFASQPDEILRRLGTQVVPVDEPERVEQRREQVVNALSRAIRVNARQRSTARARIWLGFGLAASLALGVGAAVHLRHHAPDASALAATVAEVHGAVVITESGESRVLSNGTPFALRAIGEIETAPDGQAEIRSQKSVLRIAAATKLTVPQATNVEERYRLALGRVDVSVDKNSPLVRSVVVETPNAEVVVHGTVFAVGVSHTDHTVTDVSVTRGSVWVLANGVQVALLGPGQHWSSDPQPVTASVPVTAPVPGPAPAPAAEPPVTRLDEHPSLPVTHVSPHERAVAEARASALAEESRLFQDAIDARNRGDDARAVELFSHLVQRYPSYEEAEVQLFRAERRLGRMATAAAEARRYLALHPQGFAHEEARTLALSSATAQSAAPLGQGTDGAR